MSILLDALKKSEQQRKLGATPDIHDNSNVRPNGPATVHQWLPLSMMAISVIVMAWFGGQQFREPELREAEVPQLASSAESADDGARPPGFGDQARRPSRKTANSDQVDSGSVSGEDNPGQRTPVESLPPGEQSLRDITIKPPTESQGSEEQLARLNESVANYQAAPGGDNAVQEPQVTAREETAAAPPATTDDSEGIPRRSRVQPHIAEPISYWELPQGVRDNLPDFNITVMVYAENPVDRFLLIDGDRLVEKEVWDSGVVLDEIRRDGAVFKYRKYRFLVKG